jgi:hypothetical protein
LVGLLVTATGVHFYFYFRIGQLQILASSKPSYCTQCHNMSGKQRLKEVPFETGPNS